MSLDFLRHMIRHSTAPTILTPQVPYCVRGLRTETPSHHNNPISSPNSRGIVKTKAGISLSSQRPSRVTSVMVIPSTYSRSQTTPTVARLPATPPQAITTQTSPSQPIKQASTISVKLFCPLSLFSQALSKMIFGATILSFSSMKRTKPTVVKPPATPPQTMTVRVSPSQPIKQISMTTVKFFCRPSLLSQTPSRTIFLTTMIYVISMR